MSQRDPTDDPEDEDLDDLDDLLPTFTRPAPTASSSKPPTSSATSRQSARVDDHDHDEHQDLLNPNPNEPAGALGQDGGEEEDPEFEAELARGMETLLKELGMGGIPAGTSSSTSTSNSNSNAKPSTGTGKGESTPSSSSATSSAPASTSISGEEAQMQKLLESLFSGEMDMEGLDLGSLGLPAGGNLSSGTKANASTSTSTGTGAGAGASTNAGANAGGKEGMGREREALTFEETIERTMRNLKDGAEDAKKSQPTSQDPLLALLAQLTSNPDALKDLDLDGLDLSALGLGQDGADGSEDGGEGGMGGVLDGMMRGLMTKEILMEPLEELAEKYPPYLASQTAKPTIPAEQLEAYRTQSRIISSILRLFRSPGYSDEDETQRKEVYGLMCKMQEMGSPPEEVMGEMPEGLGFGDEACTIM